MDVVTRKRAPLHSLVFMRSLEKNSVESNDAQVPDGDKGKILDSVQQASYCRKPIGNTELL